MNKFFFLATRTYSLYCAWCYDAVICGLIRVLKCCHSSRCQGWLLVASLEVLAR